MRFQVWTLRDSGQTYGPRLGAAVELAIKARAFHWPLKFPDVITSKPCSHRRQELPHSEKRLRVRCLGILHRLCRQQFEKPMHGRQYSRGPLAIKSADLRTFWVGATQIPTLIRQFGSLVTCRARLCLFPDPTLVMTTESRISALMKTGVPGSEYFAAFSSTGLLPLQMGHIRRWWID